MVTKTATKTTGAPQPGRRPITAPTTAPKPRRRPEGLDADQLRELDETIAERLRNPGSWAGKTKEQVEEEETKKLLKSLKGDADDKIKYRKSGGCGYSDPCGNKKKPELDLELLADKIFQRLIYEARVERERAGWAS
jgi:hypothetical protein